MSKQQKSTTEAVKTTSATTTSSAPKFTIKKEVTLPIRKLTIDEPAYLKVTSKIVQGKKIKDEEEAAHIMNVIDLETGASGQVVVPSVLMGIFEDNYENQTYVGVCFQIIKGRKPSGKRYHTFTVCEVEVGE